MSNWYAALVMCLLAGLGLGPRPALAQRLPSPGPRTCATPQAEALQQAQLVRRQPGYRVARAAAGRPPWLLGAAATTYTLPVVVHIIYDGEAVGTGSNISQAQVQSQLDVLNEDYRNRNADGAQVPGAFQALRSDAQFQFQLAGIDPGGRPLAEPGIDRVNRRDRNWQAPPYGYAGGSADLSFIESVIKPQTSWNPEQYVNVWVLALGGGLLGYAQLPDNTAGLAGLFAQGGLPETDGVVVRYAAFGRTGTLLAGFDKGRTLTHELGHFLGLRHIWGDADCGDDYVADTPTQQTSNIGCPAFPHVSCANGPSGDLFMDYMDYTNDACMGLFSAGQTSRMQAVLAAGTPRRSSLPTSPALCQPLAATASSSPACLGGAATLAATGPAGATYAWSGPSGFSSSQQNPVIQAVTASQAGTYTVLVSAAGSYCPGQASTTLVVNAPPPVPQPTASASLVCPGRPVVLSAGRPAGPGPYTYAWSLVSGDGLPASAATASIVVQPTVPSVYQLAVSYAGQSCASTATVAVGVSQPVWTGAAGDGDWFNAANWLGCVPTRTTDALVPVLGSGLPYPTLAAGAAEVRTLTLQGSLALRGGSLQLYGDLAGDGSLIQTGGQVMTLGAGPQALRGGAYLDLVVGGAGPKTIGSATIGQRLLLAGGVLRTGAATLTLAPTATLAGETDASYVLGTLQTTRPVVAGPDSVGNLGVRISAAVAPGLTTVRRVTGQPQGAAPAQGIGRYYDIAAATGRSQSGAMLTLAYLPHELNGLPASNLVLYKSATGVAWTNEGATTRNAAAGTVARAYATDLNGRWTLASPAAPLPAAPASYAIQAFPVPFAEAGLSLQVTTPTAGPLYVQLYDVLGRRLYDHTVASVDVGTSTVLLPGSGQLAPASYIVVVQQAGQTVHLRVVRQ